MEEFEDTNIEKAKNIQEIRYCREQKNKWDFKNGDNSRSIITGLYGDKFHFIFELLQNAEDNGAKEVCFILTKDKLILEHNGKEFDLEDIKSITNYGATTKKGSGKIGKFGIGFKSVFTITDNPKIYSGQFSFEIKNENLPYEIEPETNIQTITKFIFPLKNEDCYNVLKENFKLLKHETILFLKNITMITIRAGEDDFILKKNEEFPYVYIKYGKEEKSYLYFSKPYGNNNLNIAIAYAIKDNKIVKEPNTKLNVFFPTEIDSHLNFFINAPFDTTPTRENIVKNSDSKVNENLWNELLNLYDESLEKIRKMKLIDINFLNALPIEKTEYRYCDKNWEKFVIGKPEFYQQFWLKTFEKLKSEDFIPLASGNFGKTLEIALTDSFMPNLVSTELLFKTKAKRDFVSTEITRDKNNALFSYLKDEHRVVEINFDSFSRALTEEILNNLSDDWLMKYYQKAADMESSIKKNIFNDVPIIRTESNQQVKIQIDGMPNVYYPNNWLSKDKKIKSIFMQDEICQKFFKLLNIPEANELAYLTTEVIPKIIDILEKDLLYIDKKEYYDQISLCILVFQDFCLEKEKIQQFKEIFDGKIIFLCNNINGEMQKLKAKECIMFSPENVELYSDSEGVYIVDYNLIHYLKEKEKYSEQDIDKFFKAVGVNEHFILKELHYVPEKKKTLQFLGREHTYTDYKILDFEKIMKNFNYYKSKLIVNFVTNPDIANNEKFYNIMHRWFYRTYNYDNGQNSQFLDDLLNTEWIVDKSNNKCKISNLTSNEFVKLFNIDENTKNSYLFKKLNFKSDVIDFLPENDRKSLEMLKKYNVTPESLELMLKNQDIEANKKEEEYQTKIQYSEEYDIDTTIHQYLGLDINKITEINSIKKIENENEAVNDATNNNRKIDEKFNRIIDTCCDLKQEGKHGERIVLYNLFDNYEKEGYDILNGTRGEGFGAKKDYDRVDVIYKNDVSETFGYDIEIKKNGQIIKFIEVKTKHGEGAELIDLSGTQWGVAKNCYLNQDIEYCLTVVRILNDKNSIQTIGNPYELWIDGEIYATPISIRVK